MCDACCNEGEALAEDLFNRELGRFGDLVWTVASASQVDAARLLAKVTEGLTQWGRDASLEFAAAGLMPCGHLDSAARAELKAAAVAFGRELRAILMRAARCNGGKEAAGVS